ncbi:hypothetical protein [Halobellus rubicundus]|uniref:CopG family transcriptional regulator n=1 Tax=Halobellus rubicundus TaxID=2996466 RepID=A0ABD5MHI1_9EURY
MSTREYRVTLALKYHHLDNLSPKEIRDRFEREGVGDYAVSTIRDYLNEAPADEILEQIEQQHANVRLQSAERYEQLYQRARKAEHEATRDEPIQAVVPRMDTVGQNEEPLRVADWKRVPPDDDRRPEWADERDTIVVFVDDVRHLEAGQEYPVGARRAGQPARPGTQPEYRKATVGVERDVDDPKGQAMARQEQAKYQEQKGDVLGIYSTDVNLSVDGEVETIHKLGESERELALKTLREMQEAESE